MIDFLEQQTSESQSSAIKKYLHKNPHAQELLNGLLLELIEKGSKAAVLQHIQQQKEKARKNLFSKTTPTTTTH